MGWIRKRNNNFSHIYLHFWASDNITGFSVFYFFVLYMLYIWITWCILRLLNECLFSFMYPLFWVPCLSIALRFKLLWIKCIFALYFYPLMSTKTSLLQIYFVQLVRIIAIFFMFLYSSKFVKFMSANSQWLYQWEQEVYNILIKPTQRICVLFNLISDVKQK